ncbi:hypothetical protein MESS2_1030033 [Mesorhizobium metallidurans STM 2683]|uniref:Uncharacterized protein n=1 Tax=Mesorhizobium metallidurans STM 2683 TaxID=1297569 RepID=M5ETY2_9HYPH|nr:hypothetical protein MESS2_1030033 [Mesorhizobium metallidurans STM 2683]
MLKVLHTETFRAGLRRITPLRSRAWRRENLSHQKIDVYANVNFCYPDFNIGPPAVHGLIPGPSPHGGGKACRSTGRRSRTRCSC